MSQINLAETIQQNLGFPPLKKIDPNTQEVKKDSGDSSQHLAQAAIPAMLTGLYLYATSINGADVILRGNKSTNWVETLFKSAPEAIRKVAHYADIDEPTAAQMMEIIADEAIKIVRQHIPAENATPQDVNNFFTGQRDKILIYLPAALQIGQTLKDDTLDDRTNKMEGPVSGFMHRVEKAFSGSTNETKP